MPTMPSLFEIFIAIILVWAFFLTVLCLGFTLTTLEREGGTSVTNPCFSLRQIDFDNSRHIDEDREYYDDGEQPEYDPEDFYNTDSPDYDEDNSFIIRRDFLDEV